MCVCVCVCVSGGGGGGGGLAKFFYVSFSYQGAGKISDFLATFYIGGRNFLFILMIGGLLGASHTYINDHVNSRVVDCKIICFMCDANFSNFLGIFCL